MRDFTALCKTILLDHVDIVTALQGNDDGIEEALLSEALTLSELGVPKYQIRNALISVRTFHAKRLAAVGGA